MTKKGLIKDVTLVSLVIILAIATAYTSMKLAEVKPVVIPGIEVVSPPEVGVSAIRIYFKGNDIWVDVTVKNLVKSNQTAVVKVTAYGLTVVLKTGIILPDKEKTVSAQFVAKTSFPEQIKVVVEKA